MKLTNRDKRTNIRKEIDKLVEELEKFEVGSKDYITRITIIEKLDKLEGAKTKPKVVHTVLGPIIIAGVGLAQTIIILKHEQINVITSKALGFVLRGRV